jgi:hypothetical protein
VGPFRRGAPHDVRQAFKFHSGASLQRSSKWTPERVIITGETPSANVRRRAPKNEQTISIKQLNEKNEMLTTQLHQTTKQIRRALLATAVALTFAGPARADGLRPIDAKSIDLGGVSGVAYYTIEGDGFHVVTTLAEGEAGTPMRVVSILSPGQRVVLSTSTQAARIEISREGDRVLVHTGNPVSN